MTSLGPAMQLPPDLSDCENCPRGPRHGSQGVGVYQTDSRLFAMPLDQGPTQARKQRRGTATRRHDYTVIRVLIAPTRGRSSQNEGGCR